MFSDSKNHTQGKNNKSQKSTSDALIAYFSLYLGK